MSEKRKDPRGRILRTGESYDSKTGRYRYSYKDAKGVRRSIYSWTLTKNDLVPAGKKQKRSEALREREKQIEVDLANEIDTAGGNMTIVALMKRYIALKNPDVRPTTRNGYRTQVKFMESNYMGHRKINTLTATEAEEWLVELHTKFGKSYSTLHTLRGILRPAYAMAKRNRWVVDNVFDFPMNKKKYGGTKTRDALTRAEMRRFLDFVRTDKHYKMYFNGVYILFNTGLRISEFCGLTPEDIDYDQHVIHVRRQLLRLHDGDSMLLYLEEPKTVNGKRDVPMTADVEKAFRQVIKNRPKVKEKVVKSLDGTMEATGFLWIDKNGEYEIAQHWSNHLRWAQGKYNRLFKEELPKISPHVCRHTFCSNMAGLGMSPKTLQTIMGHSSIEVTLNVYTHLEPDVLQLQFFSNPAYNLYPLEREPDIISLDDTSDEGDPDFTEEPDDDD